MTERTGLRPCPICAGPDPRIVHVTDPHIIGRCRECAFTYLANPPEEVHYDDFWGADLDLPEEYGPEAREPSLREVYLINTRRVAWLQHRRAAGTLLDVGCGNGFFLKSARDAGFEVSGQEISANAAEFARRNFHLPMQLTELSRLTEETDVRYDIITLWHVLEHFNRPLDVLNLLRQMLNSQGLLVVEVPNLNSLKFKLTRWRWEGGNHPDYHRSFFTATTLRNALFVAGFRKIRRTALSYRLPDHSLGYYLSKRILNGVARDAFLCFTATN